MFLFPPEPLLLFLESQAPGELWGHIGTVPVVIPSGCEMLRASLCLCYLCLCVCVAHVVGLNGLPEVNSFTKAFLPFKESAQSPPNTLVHTLQTVVKCGLDQILEGIFQTGTP